ncbi:MAG TPA: citrate/2-methylcitrate synthase, partial [Hymenobacter sp.]
MAESAELILDGKSISLPVIEGTEHEKAFDIGKLRDQTGYVTLDSGYKNTGATKSAITFLDGEEGILRYRGYPIEQLAEKSSFLEVAYLLIYGALPTQAEFDNFRYQITQHTLIHEDIRKILDGFPSSAHPMGILSSLVCSLTAFYPKSIAPEISKEELNLNIVRLMAKISTIAAWSYKNSVGHPLIYPRNDLDYCANFLYMMFSFPTEKYELNPVVVSALNKLLILHADHEQNCSTSTVRLVGSANASLYGSVSAGINALWGPLHGGANQEVVEMLEAIQADGGNTQKWVDKAKDKN